MVFPLVGFSLCCFLMAGAVFLEDPLHILRPPETRDFYDSESRFAMPGMILHHTSPHAILGTSVVQDFDEGYYRQKTGQDISRYLLTGGTGYEQRRMLETLLDLEKPPEQILWGLDPASFTGDLQSIRWEQFPGHLFSHSPSRDLTYIFSFQSFYRLLRQLPDRFSPDGKRYSETTRFRYEALARPARFKDLPAGLDTIAQIYCGQGLFDRIARLQDFDFSTASAQISHNIVTPVQAHPDIRFVLYFPPYSLVQFVEYQKAGVLEPIMAFRTQVLQQLAPYPNVKIYDFQSDPSLITAYSAYHDSIHYGRSVMHRITDDVVSGHNLVTTSHIGARNKIIKNMLEKNSKALWQKIKGTCAKTSDPVQDRDLLKN